MGKEDFIMPLRYKSRFERWDSEKCKAILMAMFEYKETGEVINLPDAYLDAFDAIRSDMDIINAAYEEKCRINAENGAKGGAPIGNQNARKQPKQPKTTETTQNNLKIGYDTDIDIDKIRYNNLNNKKVGSAALGIQHISDILGG